MLYSEKFSRIFIKSDNLLDSLKKRAIIHVLRCFDNGNITHVDGSIDPVRDKGIIDTELQLKDLSLIHI